METLEHKANAAHRDWQSLPQAEEREIKKMEYEDYCRDIKAIEIRQCQARSDALSLQQQLDTQDGELARIMSELNNHKKPADQPAPDAH